MISPFVLVDGQSGDFELSVKRTGFGIGRRFGKHLVLLQLANESVLWNGSISMGPKGTSSGIVGIDYRYELWRKGIFLIPVSIQYWSLSKKTLKFNLFPNDSITLGAGQGANLSLGIGFEF